MALERTPDPCMHACMHGAACTVPRCHMLQVQTLCHVLHMPHGAMVLTSCAAASAAAEFWCRYVRYLEAIGSQENAEGAVQRATLVYCKARPEMHLFAAR